MNTDEYQDYLDDTDGNYASWLCETCGDPAYDCDCEDDSLVLEDVTDNEPCCHGILIGACGCDDEPVDLEDEMDRLAERFPNGIDIMVPRENNWYLSINKFGEYEFRCQWVDMPASFVARMWYYDESPEGVWDIFNLIG